VWTYCAGALRHAISQDVLGATVGKFLLRIDHRTRLAYSYRKDIILLSCFFQESRCTCAAGTRHYKSCCSYDILS